MPVGPEGLTGAQNAGLHGARRPFERIFGLSNCSDISFPEPPQIIGREPSTSEDKTMSDVAERVKKIVVEHLGVEPEKVQDNANFIDDLGADSLDTVELVMAFEEEFNVEIPDDAAETIVTVGDAVRFLEKNAG
jgi:acyl carrier protein